VKAEFCGTYVKAGLFEATFARKFVVVGCKCGGRLRAWRQYAAGEQANTGDSHYFRPYGRPHGRKQRESSDSPHRPESRVFTRWRSHPAGCFPRGRSVPFGSAAVPDGSGPGRQMYCKAPSNNELGVAPRGRGCQAGKARNVALIRKDGSMMAPHGVTWNSRRGHAGQGKQVVHLGVRGVIAPIRRRSAVDLNVKVAHVNIMQNGLCAKCESRGIYEGFLRESGGSKRYTPLLTDLIMVPHAGWNSLWPAWRRLLLMRNTWSTWLRPDIP
jgi:hypothetical protein